MSLQARYDPQADRMRLTLQSAEGSLQAFWVTRRQWLGWLRALLLLPQPRDAESARSERAPPKPPKPRRQRGAADDSVEPQPLTAIRLRRAGERVQVVFAVQGERAAARAATLTLPPEGVEQMRDLLQQQAEQAGWDPGAALTRLNASAMTGAALRKASRSD